MDGFLKVALLWIRPIHQNMHNGHVPKIVYLMRKLNLPIIMVMERQREKSRTYFNLLAFT